MKMTCGRTSPVVAAVLVALAVVAAAVGPAPKRRGQEIHLFEATVRFPDDGVDELDYNYRLLAKVLGSVEAARRATYDSELGVFSALITNNQGRRLSKVPGVLKVTRLEDPPSLPETDGHL
ncbi:uncharacterized protein [Zea mays]|uniref:Uncharacterized protein n=1 Tax=Zea mays TaxID=4577 RepID=A0A804MB43_MAIZE|nr:uncharacterized protein LOC103646002 [Zea mays]|eukprot:XP_008668967.1 uncharacterized protein LOC103646002 [Zea mays]